MKIALLTSKTGGMIEKLVAELKALDYVVFSNNPNEKLEKRCKLLNLQLIYFNEEAELYNYDFDLWLLCGYMKILSKRFVTKNAVINYHPGLRDLKGKDPQIRALKEFKEGKRKTTGGMIHYVDETVDGGKVISQFEEEINKNDNEQSLTERMEKKAIELIVQHILRCR